jgi:hypothetical protein
LQTIPDELYEAARVDGANGWQRFRAVTEPAIRPGGDRDGAAVVDLDGELVRECLAAHAGRPSDATIVFPCWPFGMQTQRIGEAAAVSVAMLPVLAILVFAGTAMMQRRTVGRDEAARMKRRGDCFTRRALPQLRRARGRGADRAVPDLLDGLDLAEAAAGDLPPAGAVAACVHAEQLPRYCSTTRGSSTISATACIVAGAVTVISLSVSALAAYAPGALPDAVPGLIGRLHPLRLPHADVAAVHSALHPDGEARSWAIR